MIKLKDLLFERTIKVPNGGEFKTYDAAKKWLDKNVKPNDRVSTDVIAGDTGEILVDKGARWNRVTAEDPYDELSSYSSDFEKKVEKLFTILVKNKIPLKVSRKDNNKLDDNDSWNVQQYLDKKYGTKGDTFELDIKGKYANVKHIDEYENFSFAGNRSSANDFEDLFDIKEVDFGKGLSDEEKKMYTDGDYEWEFTYPREIKRKDGKPFTNIDAHNIKEYAKWFSKYVLSYNVVLSTYAPKGKKVAELEPQFG